MRISPDPGVSFRLQAKEPDRVALRDIHLDMDFASEGGEGPTPYEELLHAAMLGDRSHFAREDAVEDTWRIVQPLLDAPPPLNLYEPGSWGPSEAHGIVAGYGVWHDPWMPR
jgi:glucose-6-phosphate 1-dehydrogenase